MMSGPITDLPIRVCPSCTVIFIQDDRMYEDTAICPRCGSDLSATVASGGGTIRTAFHKITVLGTKDGDALRISSSRWG
jgi:hypothetical protein